MGAFDVGGRLEQCVIEVVSNSPEYFEFIRVLRNDDRVRSGFIDQTDITPEQQAAYMAVHGDEYLVALADGVPVGYAGSVDGDIRVCTHPDHQGRGIGRALILAVVRRFPGSRARIKIGNTASLRLFESCGFTPTFILMDPPADAASDEGREEMRDT